MEIIDSTDSIISFANTININSKVSRFLIQGVLHEGHLYFIKKIKEKDPNTILIVQYQELDSILYNYLLFDSYPKAEQIEHPFKKYLYNSIINSTLFDKNIDYLVLNKIQSFDKVDKIFLRVREDYHKYMIPEARRLGLNNTLAVEAMFVHIVLDPIRQKIQALGKVDSFEMKTIKYLIQPLLHQKVFGSNYPDTYENIFNSTIWEFFKNQDGSIKTRSGGATKLSFLRNLVVKALKEGMAEKADFEKYIINRHIIVDREFSILDLKSLEPLDKINENCALVMMCLQGNDFIYIKDGKII